MGTSKGGNYPMTPTSLQNGFGGCWVERNTEERKV